MMITCCSPTNDTFAEKIESVSSARQTSSPKEVPEVTELPATGSPITKNVVLKRTSTTTPWGLQFEQVAESNALLITGLLTGAAQDYNKGNHGFEIRKYDCIVGVNGEKSLRKMTTIINDTATQVELQLKRPATVKETLKRKDGQSFGMVLRHTEGGMTVTVKEIKDIGSVKESEANICEGDMIVAVDGKMGVGSALLNHFTTSRGASTLILLRINSLPKTGPPCTKKITLTRTSPSAPWGLEYEEVAESNILLITGVSDGAAQDYNNAHHGFELKEYDCIVGVDGDRSLSNMLMAMNGTATQVELRLKRPATVKETLHKDAHQSYGLVLRHLEAGMTMNVKDIKDGSVKKSGANIREGDIIVAVNGEMGSGRALLDLFTNTWGSPKLVLLRVNSLPKTGSPITKKVIVKRTFATTPWGLEYEQVAESDTLLITGLSHGAAQDFNNASQDFELQPWDCIVEVNGETSLVDMMKAMNEAATQVELTMKRPATLKETVKKEDGESYGLVVRHTETGMTATVKEIKNTGTVKKSNANIREGDLIVAVNGEMGLGSELLDLLTHSRMVSDLTLLRASH